MNRTLMHNIPFVEAHHQGTKQRPKSILIRISETTSASGAALGIANAWHRAGDNVDYIDTCHYVVDSEATYQCVPDNFSAFPTPYGSKNTISINVCAQPVFYANFWLDKDYSMVLDRTASLVADLSDKHGIPVRDIDLIKHRKWLSRGGLIICVKGAWPTELFLDKVRQLKK